MPTLLDANGFQVRVLLPPREHGPPHVHVHKGGGEVVITLPDGAHPLGIRTISHMRTPDVLAAWRKYHG